MPGANERRRAELRHAHAIVLVTRDEAPAPPLRALRAALTARAEAAPIVPFPAARERVAVGAS
jgi:hypothetical protein